MNKKKIVKFVFYLFFLAFVISYIIEETGYYEYNLQNNMIMTNESMLKFEKDIKEGKDVTLDDYVVNTYNDYTSHLTRGTNKVSLKVNYILKKGIEDTFKLLSKLTQE